MAGFDFGVKTFLTGSDATVIESPQFFNENRKALAKAQKALSRKQKGSYHRHQALLAVARIHRQIANQRRDWYFKTAKALVTQYDVIYLETLNLKAMQKMWGRKISDYGFAEFVTILKYQAAQYGCQLTFIDRWFPSSKTCSQCGGTHEALTLKDRSWDCPHCGVHHDRDRNAAINILTVGVSTAWGEPVRPVVSGMAC